MAHFLWGVDEVHGRHKEAMDFPLWRMDWVSEVYQLLFWLTQENYGGNGQIAVSRHHF